MCNYGEEAFSLDTGTVLFDRALLADTVQKTPSPTNSPALCTSLPAHNEMVVGVSVGVTLGVLMVAAFGWAIWEHRMRMSQRLKMDSVSPSVGSDAQVLRTEAVQRTFIELGSERQLIAELGQELPELAGCEKVK